MPRPPTELQHEAVADRCRHYGTLARQDPQRPPLDHIDPWHHRQKRRSWAKHHGMWPSRLEKSSTDRIRRAQERRCRPHRTKCSVSIHELPLIQKVREFMTGSPTSQKAPHAARCWLPSAQTSSLNPGNRVRTGSSLWNGSATRRMSIVLKRNKKRSKAMCASELDGGGRAVLDVQNSMEGGNIIMQPRQSFWENQSSSTGAEGWCNYHSELKASSTRERHSSEGHGGHDGEHHNVTACPDVKPERQLQTRSEGRTQHSDPQCGSGSVKAMTAMWNTGKDWKWKKMCHDMVQEGNL